MNDIAFAYFDCLDFHITDSIPPDLRRSLTKVQAGHLRAVRASTRPRNIRRASHHLRCAIKLLSKHRHRFELLPSEAFTAQPRPLSEPNYEQI